MYSGVPLYWQQYMHRSSGFHGDITSKSNLVLVFVMTMPSTCCPSSQEFAVLLSCTKLWFYTLKAIKKTSVEKVSLLFWSIRGFIFWRIQELVWMVKTVFCHDTYLRFWRFVGWFCLSYTYKLMIKYNIFSKRKYLIIPFLG